MQFVDECKIELKAGDGGNGIISWHHEAHVNLGGPAGGDGGNGGNIYLLADHNEASLFDLRYIKLIKAENGVNGQSENCYGAKGKDKVVKVPVGTVVYDEDGNVIVDLNKDKQSFLICKGGKGGLGNASLKSSMNKAPNLYERGELGEDKKVVLKLKYLADIGIIGLPNAGKSTLIKTICHVNSKIAPYPFTTITPVLGTYFYQNKPIIFCDIPGLIEGAASGKGLGHEFLKHVERCNLLVHLVSGDVNDNENIISSYKTIMDELKAYSEDLLKKPMLVAVSKADTDGAKDQFNILKKYLGDEKQLYFISCHSGQNIDLFTNEIIKQFFYAKDQQAVLQAESETNQQALDLVHENEQVLTMKQLNNDHEENSNINDAKLKIYTDDNDHLHVSHPILKYWAHRIPMDTRDNIYRFNQKMAWLKLNDVLKKHGLKPNDQVIIDDDNIEWIVD